MGATAPPAKRPSPPGYTRSGCGGWQIRNEPERHRQLVELEVRLQEGHGAVRARLARHLHHVDPRLGERALGLHRRRRVRHGDVVVDPAVEERLDLGARREAADLVAHHHLEVVREPRHGEDVRELRREAGVGRGRGRVVHLGLLRRLHAEEGRVIGAFAVQVAVGSAVSTAVANVATGVLLVSLAGFVAGAVAGILFAAAAGALIDLILGSGGKAAPNLDHLKFYTGTMPDGMALANELSHYG